MPSPIHSPLLRLFARNLRAARKQAELFQEALAEKAGLHPTYIGLLEREQGSISLLAIERFAKALRMEPWHLMHPAHGSR